MEADENTNFYCAAPIAGVKAPAMDFIPQPRLRAASPASLRRDNSPPPPYRSLAHADEVRACKVDAYRALIDAALTPAIRAYWRLVLEAEEAG